MNLVFDADVSRYRSPSQKARVLTETWTAKIAYCPRCGNGTLNHFENNAPVKDFFCPACYTRYEQKSSKKDFGARVLASDYQQMMDAVRNRINPDLFLLTYDILTLSVRSFFVIPKHFFHPGIIIPRPPLRATARRAGWTGCLIQLSEIPYNGRIYIVKDGFEREKSFVLKQYHDTLFLEDQAVSARGWLLDVWNCVNQLPATFNLNNVYAFEPQLKNKYPGNMHVRDKIRQQLQILRDKNIIQFNGNGRYSKISDESISGTNG